MWPLERPHGWSLTEDAEDRRSWQEEWKGRGRDRSPACLETRNGRFGGGREYRRGLTCGNPGARPRSSGINGRRVGSCRALLLRRVLGSGLGLGRSARRLSWSLAEGLWDWGRVG